MLIPESTNPFFTFQHHLKANATILGNAPLFAYEIVGHGWASLSQSWFLNQVISNEIW